MHAHTHIRIQVQFKKDRTAQHSISENLQLQPLEDAPSTHEKIICISSEAATVQHSLLVHTMRQTACEVKVPQ